MIPEWPWWIWLEAAALSAAALPVLRVSERLRTVFPRVAAIFTLTMVAWLMILIGLAHWWPTGLSVLMVLVIVVGAAAAWYSRPAFGRTRGLPPGSLSVPVSISAIADRDFYRRQAERYGPVFKMAQFHQPVVCVVGLERGHRLIREHDEALGPSPQPVTDEIPRGFLRYMDHEAHAIYGPLFRQALSAQVVADSLPVMRSAVRRELARPSDAQALALDPTPILERITDAAFLRAFFGVEPVSSVYDAMVRAYEPLSRLRLSEALTQEARGSLVELRRLVSTCAGHSSHASRSAMTELRRLAARMPDDTCIDNLIFMWKVSAPNAVGLLRWLVAVLGENPDWCARLQAELRRDHSDGQLLDRVISETLRLSQSEYPLSPGSSRHLVRWIPCAEELAGPYLRVGESSGFPDIRGSRSVQSGSVSATGLLTQHVLAIRQWQARLQRRSAQHGDRPRLLRRVESGLELVCHRTRHHRARLPSLEPLATRAHPAPRPPRSRRWLTRSCPTQLRATWR